MKLPDGQKKTDIQIAFRVNEDQKQFINKATKELELNFSEVCRNVLITELQKRLEERRSKHIK
jgi:uncharacterized protein (DUF1778 family)